MQQNQLIPRGIKIRPIVIGSVLLFFGVKIAADKVSEISEWNQLAQARDIQTQANITNTQVIINSSSGKNMGYEVRYEFTAPGSGGSGSSAGSSTSAAEIEAYLEEQFWNPNGQPLSSEETTTPGTETSETETLETETSESEISETETLEAETATASETLENSKPALPAGEKFFQGQQRVSVQDYNLLSLGSEISVMYAEDDPSNSAILGTNSAPSPVPLFIPGLFFVLSGWLFWVGVKQRFEAISK